MRKRDGGAVGERGAGRHQQIALGVDATELRGLDEAVEKGGQRATHSSRATATKIAVISAPMILAIAVPSSVQSRARL